MALVPFTEWLPDQADFRNPGTLTATNVYPTASGYSPAQGFVDETNALDAYPRGAMTLKDSSGNVRQYAGDAAKLYERVSQTWTDRSKAGGYATGDDLNWEFTRWKDKILATNFSDDPQQLTLGGTTFSDLTTALQGKHVDVVRSFVVFGNTNDSSDGHVPNRVRWSANGDETDYTVSASTQSDFQDLPTGGAVRRVIGGEFGVIVMERSIYRMSFVGSPTVFQFDEVLPGIGTLAATSVVRDGDTIYFWSERGIFALDSGTRARPIGANKVDNFVLADLDQANSDRISGMVDVANNRILWAYPGADSNGGTPNRILIYDVTLDRFSLIERDVALIYRAAGVATSMDSLDSTYPNLDEMTISLDDKSFKGGVSVLGGFDTAFKAGTFKGSNLTATLDTKEMELSPGRNTRLNGFRPMVDGGGTITAQVGERNKQNETVSFGATLSQRGSGRFTTRSNARYHRFRLLLAGDWQNAVGVQLDPSEVKQGGRRG